MNILGVKIDNLSKRNILKDIENFLDGNEFCQVATVNPEFILQAQKDKEFKNILNNCDLNIADGIGLKFASLRFGKKLKHRIAGVDLLEKILQMAEKRNLKVHLISAKNSLSDWEEVAVAIRKKYPRLKISGNSLNKNYINKNLERDWSDKDIVFVNFGAPEQEKFIFNLKKQKNDIKLAMGVGGSFDFIAGKIKRAPKLMRKLGVEWLWRLMIESRYRIKRIFSAVIIFPLKVIFNK